MKVLQVINSLHTGGAEKLLLETIPRYRDAGVEMDILLLDGTVTPFLSALKENSKCTVYFSSKASVYHPLHIFRLRKYLKNYDIVHVHLFPSLYWVALSIFFFRIKTKTIFTEHSSHNRRRHSFYRVFERWIYSKYDTIITISENSKQNLKQHIRGVKNNLVTINNGVAISKFINASESAEILSKKVGNKKFLIQVSRFYYPKDQNTVIRCLQHLPQEVALLLVGNGKEIHTSKKLVTKLGLENRVHFLGLRSDVPALLKASDIVILSSQYEGLSLSSIEGMASGKPFIASEVPGLTEIVKNAGILFSVGNEKELALRISELLENKELYANVALKCQQRAAQYSIEHMVESHLKLYKSL
ncbi:glycosyltransferase [Jejudonia soesokkakensis]|uniref:Glycosyltransferase n=1 Tax=Jejudonia soesokkakensis TaxID=1323432 RepID=A0ABW2MRA0_9FLAO